MKKNSCTPLNPKKYSCNGLNKIHAKNLITKKNSCNSKIPLPPHNFSNGPSLIACLTITDIIGVVQRNLLVSLRCSPKVRWPAVKVNVFGFFRLFSITKTNIWYSRGCARPSQWSARRSRNPAVPGSSRALIGHLLELFSVVPLEDQILGLACKQLTLLPPASWGSYSCICF